MTTPTRKRLAAAGSVALLATTLGACRFTGWNDAASRATADDATAWLVDQQLPDGSFEVAGFAGFETPDAVMAIAEGAQSGPEWDEAEALAAVEAVVTGGNSALDALDDQADGELTAASAAKLTILVALPLGLDPSSFDPQGDGAADLLGAIDADLGPDGSYGTFNATLYAVAAKRAAGQAVSAQTLDLIRGAQQVDGGWNFLGDPTGTGSDVDTTAMAVIALVSAGLRDHTDAAVLDGLTFLAEQQQLSGAWSTYGSDDPNSTSMAVLAVTGAGYDPAVRCWRDHVAPSLSGEPYASPLAWLQGQQDPSGRILSPSDGWGVNTFATSQSIQALRRSWMPVNASVPRQVC